MKRACQQRENAVPVNQGRRAGRCTVYGPKKLRKEVAAITIRPNKKETAFWYGVVPRKRTAPCQFLCGGELSMATRTRNQVIAFRVTPAERRQISAKIKRFGLSQQAYLLRAALDQPIQVVEDLKPILAELRACGRNLNQLTVLAHQGRVHTMNLRAAADALGRTDDAVNALLIQKR